MIVRVHQPRKPSRIAARLIHEKNIAGRSLIDRNLEHELVNVCRLNTCLISGRKGTKLSDKAVVSLWEATMPHLRHSMVSYPGDGEGDSPYHEWMPLAAAQRLYRVSSAASTKAARKDDNKDQSIRFLLFTTSLQINDAFRSRAIPAPPVWPTCPASLKYNSMTLQELTAAIQHETESNDCVAVYTPTKKLLTSYLRDNDLVLLP